MDRDTLRGSVASVLVLNPQSGALLASLVLETPVLGVVARRDGAPFDVRA